MERLVRVVLDMGRIEDGHSQLNYDLVDIESFTDRIVKKFIGVAESHNIEMNFNKTITEKVAIFDPDRIEQVFTNLIDNAINHSGENRSEEHTSELQSRGHLVCRLLLEKKKT